MRIRRWVSDRPVAISFYVSVIGILGVGALAYYLIARVAESEAWVVHTYEVIAQAEELHQAIVSAESAGRGFLINGNEASRAEFKELLAAMDGQFYDFKKLGADNPAQSAAADRLNRQIERRFAYLSARISIRAKQGFAALEQANISQGAAEMESIRNTLQEIKNEEARLLTIRTAARKRQNDLLKLGLVILTFGGIAIMGLVSRQVNRLWLAHKEAETIATHLAHHDPLTGLPNRRLLSDRMEGAVARAVRCSEKFAVLCLDLDGFKEINDAYGHDGGDELLKQAAVRIKASVRAIDTVARTGGDEFVVILAGIRAMEDAGAGAVKLLLSVGQPYTVNTHPASVGTSIGIAVYPVHGSTGEELLRRADTALYEAKIAGKGRYALASQSPSHAPLVSAPEALVSPRQTA